MSKHVAFRRHTTEPGSSQGGAGEANAFPPPPNGKSLRILHVIDSGGLYGAEMVLLNLGVECRKIGHEVYVGTIVAPQDDDDPLGMAAVDQGLNHVRFTMPDGFSLQGLRAIVRFADEKGIDIIHSHGYKANILMAVVPRRLRPCPVVCTLHGWTATGAGSRISAYEWLERRLVGRLDAVAVVSEKIRNRLTVSRDKVWLIANGIAVMPDAGQRTTSKKALGGVVRVLSAGRLSQEKGFDLLIRAVETLRDAGIVVEATIAGEGPARAELEKQIAAAGLQEQVHLPGYIRDMGRLFSESHIFVLCSRTEGLPLVMLEAMSHGVPVIATHVGQVPDVIGHGEYGRLIPANDSGALADAIRLELGKSEGDRADLVGRAMRLVWENYSAAVMSASYCNLYAGCINGR